jgi:predicted CopG family antitoxin
MIFKNFSGQVNMQKAITINIDEKVYYGLCKVIGKKRISRFIEDLVRPHVTDNSLEEGYKDRSSRMD